jgi:hypothetical protein
MSDDRDGASSQATEWAQLLLGVFAVLAVGVLVGAAEITAASLVVGIMLALLVAPLVHGRRQ